MFALITAWVVVTALCLAIRQLRLYGVMLVFALTLIYPLAMLAALLLGAAAYALSRCTNLTKGAFP
jgi:hypothetical protein